MSKVLTVGNCAYEEWERFWESQGWWVIDEPWVMMRRVKREDAEVYVNRVSRAHGSSAWAGISELSVEWREDTPLQQIADELDELASTKIMGGWA